MNFSRGKVQTWNPQHLSTFSAPQHHFSTLAPFQHHFSTFWYWKGAEVPIELENKIEIEVIVKAEYHTIQIQFFRSRRSYFEKTTIFYKTWLKVFRVEESESFLSFSKFWVWFFQSRKGYFEKITMFHKTWLKAFGVKESKSGIGFSN
jgi:hypothetical protein